MRPIEKKGRKKRPQGLAGLGKKGGENVTALGFSQKEKKKNKKH